MKKKLFATFIFIIIATAPLFSQEGPTSQGVYRLSGSINGSYSTSKENITEVKTLMLNISPGFSYFVANNFELGFQITYNNYDMTYSGSHYMAKDLSINNHSLLFGPNFRYYFPLSEIYPFIGASVSMGLLGKWGDFSQNFNLNSISVAAGFDYFLSRNVALEPSLSFNAGNLQYSESSTQILLGIGINYCIF